MSKKFTLADNLEINENRNIQNQNFINLDNLTLIHKGILFFLLIISGNYIGNLFSCRIQDFFKNNIIAKHSIGFISLYFFVILVEPKLQKFNPIKTLLLSIPIYFYFLVLSKTEASIFLLIMFLLILLVIFNVYYNYVVNKEKNQKLSIIETYYKNNIKILKKIIIVSIFMFSIIGILVYLGMKKVEYDKEFDLKKFFFGSIICKKNYLGDNPQLSVYSESIRKHKLNLGLIFIFIKKAFTK